MTLDDVHFRAVAQEDVIQAALHYDSEIPGLGLDFFHEVDSAVGRILKNPDVFRVVEKKFKLRKIRLKRFPFAIYFTVESSAIFVHGVIHSGRGPNLLPGRMSS